MSVVMACIVQHRTSPPLFYWLTRILFLAERDLPVTVNLPKTQKSPGLLPPQDNPLTVADAAEPIISASLPLNEISSTLH